MGWSATAKACEVERAWMETCQSQTGSQNVYEVAGKRYFYETGREQRDGAITGTVFRFVGEGCVRSGSFRIEADGTVTRYPSGLKQLINNY